VTSLEEAKGLILRTINFLTRKQSVHPQDIVVLVPTHFEGWELVKSIECHGIKINHVFEDEDKRHHHKKAFWMGDSRLKMSTIHSFKGWEILNVIILTPPDGHGSEESLDSLLYVAITRPRQNLIVFNRNYKYREYGKSWTNNWFINDEIEDNFDDIPF
jgi:DNA helicase IV